MSPAALGLYGFYFVGPFAAIFGMFGLVLKLIHGSVGYNLAVMIDLVPSHTVVEGVDRVQIEIINGIFWSLVYGVLCFSWCYFRESRANRS